MSARNLLGLLAIAAALGSAGGCDRSREASAADVDAAALPVASPDANATAAAPPRVARAENGATITRTLSLPSHLMVERNVAVTARRDGIVEEIRTDRGERVVEDQILAVLERGDLLVSERAARLEHETEQAAHDRAQRLLSQQIISDEEFEQVRLRLLAAEESLERIRYELSKCLIRSPFDGVVSGRFVEKGQFVREDDRLPLFQVTALEPLLARIYVPEWALLGLREGMAARVLPASTAAGSGDGTIRARVKWINPVVDAASSSVEVLIEVLGAKAHRALRPGLSVTVVLDLVLAAGSGGGVTLPLAALGAAAREAGATVRLRVREPDGSVDIRPVVLGVIGDDRVEIRSGLTAGEEVLLPE